MKSSPPTTRGGKAPSAEAPSLGTKEVATTEQQDRSNDWNVSKMKSAVEKMTQEKETPKNTKTTTSSSTVRRHRSSDGDSLGMFLKKGAVKAAAKNKVSSDDDRSRGAHSTMSHNLRRQERQTQRPKRGGIHSSDHISPFFQVRSSDKLPTAAECSLPTGNPKTIKKQQQQQAAAKQQQQQQQPQRSDKMKKNLELFMSQQQPLPKQELEVRSAFTSVDRRHKRKDKKIGALGAFPLPTNKEDLLQLLKASAAPTASKKSPTKNAKSNKPSKASVPQQALWQSEHVRRPLSKSFSWDDKDEPTRHVRRTASSEVPNSNRKPLKRTKASKAKSDGSGVPQFSTTLNTTVHLDRPQPIHVTTTSSPEQKQKDEGMLRSHSATDLDTENNKPIKNSTSRGTRKDTEGSTATNTTTRTTVVRRKKAAATNTDNASTTSTTTTKILSARRLHHAPASITQSPIAGRRQSLKMGLAGTASGEGPSRSARTAVVTGKKTRKVPVTTAKNKKTPQPTAPASRVDPGTGGVRQPPSRTTTTTTTTAATARPQPRRADGGEASRRRRPVKAEVVLEDVFRFYQWSDSRQAESRILAERQVLRDSIMDGGPLHRALNRIA